MFDEMIERGNLMTFDNSNEIKHRCRLCDRRPFRYTCVSFLNDLCLHCLWWFSNRQLLVPTQFKSPSPQSQCRFLFFKQELDFSFDFFELRTIFIVFGHSILHPSNARTVRYSSLDIITFHYLVTVLLHFICTSD